VSDKARYYPIITPKSNVRNIFYTDPARKAKIRLSELFQLLETEHQLYWHIENVDGAKRLRLENISWYENGGSYLAPILTYDLTQASDGRNGKPLGYDQNQYKYEKTKIPQRFEFSWMDDVSDVFDGVPIRILSDQVNLGQIEKKDAANYTSDIDMIIAKDDISLDGFAVIGAGFDGTNYSSQFENIEITPGNVFSVQNGILANKYLQPLYWRHGMPAQNIEINGEATTALSVARSKQQEVRFHDKEAAIDPLQLINTDLGTGQVEGMEYNLITGTYEITINHDTE
jgi:hypothetical protein